MYAHILISTDGSEVAQKGVDHGLLLAKRLASKITIITVTDPFPITAFHDSAILMDFESYNAAQKKFANEVLDAAKVAAEKIGLVANTVHVPDAWPASAIVDTGRALECDLIVMASHGRRGIKKVLLGSQTSEVLVTAATPVLVIR